MKLSREPITECDWAQQRIHELLIGVLARRARGRLARHLATCRRCREYMREAQHLPGLLASFGAPEAPEGLADYIKGACFFSAGMEPSQRRRHPLVLQTSMAAAAAAVLVILLGFSHLPGVPAFRLIQRPQARASFAWPVPSPALSDAARTTSDAVLAEKATVERPTSSGAPAMPASATGVAGRPRSLALSGHALPPSAASKPPRPSPRRQVASRELRRRGARIRRARSLRLAAIASPAAAANPNQPSRRVHAAVSRPGPSLAFAPGATLRTARVGPVALAEAPADAGTRIALSRPRTMPVAESATVENKGAAEDEAAAKVTNSLAAGLIAGALMERYVADAVAEQGAQLVTATCAADSEHPVVVEETVGNDDLSGL